MLRTTELSASPAAATAIAPLRSRVALINFVTGSLPCDVGWLVLLWVIRLMRLMGDSVDAALGVHWTPSLTEPEICRLAHPPRDVALGVRMRRPVEQVVGRSVLDERPLVEEHRLL